ncbi:hypothetical protein [Lentibacillus sp.]|uniref:hypothetical protein n=1 Tax=Lentibacillus sp. TaxID=1925746 RepID=UPI002B4B276B|nr:hypothetical protein [Lentibacillus sp.]HLS07692.1 hypothetical protein [Lentibacillus sp.]
MKPILQKTWYNDFIGAYAIDYQSSAHENGFEMEVADINIEQNENNENIYNFSVTVQYQKEGSDQNDAEVTGYAHMKDGKIGDIAYLEDGGLSEALKAGSPVDNWHNGFFLLK